MRLQIAFASLGVGVVAAGCGSTSTSISSSSFVGPASSSSSSTLNQVDRVARAEQSTVEIYGTVGKEVVGGSGVIVDSSKGYIVTNAHVVSGMAALKVRFNDGNEYAGRVVAKAPCDDVAIVQLTTHPSTPMVAVQMGDSSAAKAGQHVTVIGYPASFQDASKEKPTATEGSISTAGVSAEPDPSLPRYTSLIEHQAPVNPGNSGGPLLDDSGKLLGINTLANTLQGGRAIQGQYYAITSQHLQELLPDLEAGRSTVDAGWSLIPNSADIAAEVKYLTGSDLATTDGMFIVGVDSGSPADKANLQFGDIMLQLEGQPVSTFQQVCDVLQSRGAGQTVKVDGDSTFGEPPQFTADVTLR